MSETIGSIDGPTHLAAVQRIRELGAENQRLREAVRLKERLELEAAQEADELRAENERLRHKLLDKLVEEG